MTAPRLVSLCSGYGGLDTAVERLTGAMTVAHVECDAAPSRVLAARWPGVPNLGDVKDVRAWAGLRPDVVTAGYPCQPFSQAGQRKGAADPRHLWPSIAAGVELCRPSLLLCENVRGHLSLGFDRVLADLHGLGYDVRWTLLRAADVGAPHSRSRLWIAARAREAGGWPAPDGEPSAWLEDGAWQGSVGLFGPVAADLPGAAGCMVGGQRWDRPAGLVVSTDLHLLPTPSVADGMGGHRSRSGERSGELLLPGVAKAHALGGLLPTPTAADGNGAGSHGSGGPDLRTVVGSLLPTPTARDHKGPHGNPHRGVDTVPGAVALLPTPMAADGGHGRGSSAGFGLRNVSRQLLPTPRATRGGSATETTALLPAAVQPDRWGPYSAAVARWEDLTRPAPPPTEQGRNGPRLSPRFVEWLMGLPEGWVTDPELGLSRAQQLKALGNGVVPQCAEAAFALLGVSPALLTRTAAA